MLITGPRQVGKSTMLTHLFPKYRHLTFDPVQDLYGAKSDPDLFLNSFVPPIILDEIQYAPEILPCLKRKVDTLSDKGLYFLTGSQQHNVLKNIHESLAGRVGILQLRSFTAYEMEGVPAGCSPWISCYLQNPARLLSLFKGTLNNGQSLYEYLWKGGLPGLLKAPLEACPTYFSSYLSTYIERDVRLQDNITNVGDFSRFTGLMAAMTAQELNTSFLGREVGISPATATRWKEILAASFLIQEIPPYHGNIIKRLSTKKKVYFMDTGLACYLQRVSSPTALANHPLFGALFETWIVHHIHTLASLMEMPPKLYHWRTNNGAEVDVLLEWNGTFYPIEIKAKTSVSRRDARGILAFRRSYPHLDIAPGLVLYTGQEAYKLSEDDYAMPWNSLCAETEI